MRFLSLNGNLLSLSKGYEFFKDKIKVINCMLTFIEQVLHLVILLFS